MNGIKLIKDYIAQKKDVVIFCGAGLSLPLGLPDWKTLTKILLTNISEKYGEERLKVMIPPLEADMISIIDTLEYISDSTYKNEIIKITKEQLSIKNENFIIHEKIINLSNQIITTNYDIAFETYLKHDVKTFTWKDNYDLATFTEQKEYLFKLHGDINKPDTCLIFKKDYEVLYEDTTTNYFLEIAKLFTNKTLLFIGFSLTDPYIDKMFNQINMAYHGYTNKHFIVTTEENKYDKFKEYLLPLKVNDFNEIGSLLEDLANYKESIIEKLPVTNIAASNNETINIQISIPKPLNKEIDYNFEAIASSFSNLNINLIDSYFNVEKLVTQEDLDYIFIFSQIIKGQLIIEDESLKFKLIKLSDLNSLLNPLLKGLFLFVDSEQHEIDLLTEASHSILPLIIIPIGNKKLKETLNATIYKAFTKGDKMMLNQSFQIFNSETFTVQRIRKGPLHREKSITFISKLIDKKSFVKFVGRKSDQENIIRKILAIRYENKLLTIKGSGGIGKTSIISKLGIELAERGYFDKGIHFIACNPIQSFENFEFEVSQCFSLTSSKFLRDQIIENVYFKDRIIILDNFETVLNLGDKDRILDLVSFICDHSIIVVTTRQILDLDYEDVYELRNLTTDEGVELFKTMYTSPILETQDKILRRDIVERLLNNNPLAIKLISKGLPASKDLVALKNELEKDIFNKDDIDEIFESKEDYNIERSTSLYHSINYSYVNLTEPEKLAFELLSLFPDGMHMENFKSFYKASKNKEYNIGDREIKQLDNKSLLENSNGFLKLQSIISRFSDYKFKMRSEKARILYYKTAYSYNKFFIDILTDNTQIRNSTSLRILDLNTNNYLKCLETLRLIDIPVEEKITFISDVSNIFRETNQPNDFLNCIKQTDFGFNKEIKDVLSIIVQHVVFWTKDFEHPFVFIKQNYPFDKLSLWNKDNKIHLLSFNKISAIYTSEGFDLNILEIYIQKFRNKYNVSDTLFKLGYFNEASYLIPNNSSEKSYFDFEIDSANNQLNISELNTYIQLLYKKESLEMVQMTYLKSKIMTVTNDEIKKLVISNPYTKGLIQVMQAKNENDNADKTRLLNKAKENLYHIKYHYVECIIDLLNVLQDKKSKEYYHSLNEAIAICKKHYFRHLLYQLKIIENPKQKINFNNNFYKIPLNYDLVIEFINDLIKTNKNHFKRKPIKIQKNISVLNENFS